MKESVTTPSNRNGAILYEGPSMIDGAPIVVIVTGLNGLRAERAAASRAARGLPPRKSKSATSGNRKTGAMLQTWILRSDVHPVEAAQSGADASICGGCEHRYRMVVELDRRGRMIKRRRRTCYVNLGQAPSVIWQCYRAGGYATIAPDAIAETFAGALVRLGAYGDPAAAPFPMWARVVERARGHTGYTHQWRAARLRDVTAFCQASCDSPADLDKARALGLGTFRVTPRGAAPIAGEIVCPASEEAGKVTVCADCRMCDGSGRNVVIQAHGASAGFVKARALPVLN